jgi:hypothetical protein
MQWHFLLASYDVFDFQGAEITQNEGRITPSEAYERVLVTECLAYLLNTILYFEVVIYSTPKFSNQYCVVTMLQTGWHEGIMVRLPAEEDFLFASKPKFVLALKQSHIQ